MPLDDFFADFQHFLPQFPRFKHLRPALEKLLPVMAMSLWGSVPERMDITFPSLMPVSPMEEAEVRSRRVSMLTELMKYGLITAAEARGKLKEYGIL